MKDSEKLMSNALKCGWMVLNNKIFVFKLSIMIFALFIPYSFSISISGLNSVHPALLNENERISMLCFYAGCIGLVFMLCEFFIKVRDLLKTVNWG